MEEKERYITLSDRQIKDTYNNSQYFMSIKNVCKILNQQDKRIKELEEENNFLEKRNEELMIDRRDICLERNDIFEENQQLKQQLHDLPKKIVEDCKMALIKRINIISGYGRMTIDEQSFFLENEYGKDLDTILKKYGGENESKGDVGE